MKRKGMMFRFNPVLGDHKLREYRDFIVRVIGCPGMSRARVPKMWRYVETLSGRVLGMVYANALEPLATDERKAIARIYSDSENYCDVTLTRGENGTGSADEGEEE
jgi:hypothetical protein